MLTRKQQELLFFIYDRMKETGIPPSFDEMKDALDLASKSGIHRLITALEERGFIRRMPNRARALEIIKLPENYRNITSPPRGFNPSVIEGSKDKIESIHSDRADRADRADRSNQVNQDYKKNTSASLSIPIMGRIAAGVPISAIQQTIHDISVPVNMLGPGSHYALEVKGDSMIESGIFEGDIVVIKNSDHANPGDIIVALIDDEEATLKRFRRKGDSIALEASNPAYKTQIYGPDRVKVQGKLVGLVRHYN